ncbi:alpha/beta-hydrolase [Trametopsis cervina]|nr:alpha/beta-hydrolase [Trametopsis cervina]
MSFTNLRPTTVHYPESDVQNMLDLLRRAPFPDAPPVQPREAGSMGIDHAYLRALKHRFEHDWSWSALEERINKFPHFLVDVNTDDGDEFTMHFVHQRSSRPDAIPLLMLHGWPDSFYTFHKIIEPLTNPPSPDLPAFHVIAPSLPGYFMSTLPKRDGFNLADVARVLNAFMTRCLGYDMYAVQAGDWGAMIARIMSNQYPSSVVSAHFNFLLVLPPSTGSPDPSTFGETERQILANNDWFIQHESAYWSMQATKPFTIGFAIGASPLALLAYIGDKMRRWSDPARISDADVVDNVALYFLSGSFASSVCMYNQAFKTRGNDGSSQLDSLTLPIHTRAFGYSAFPYEAGGGPRAYMEPLGNLTFYKEHTGGGHFPALDSPSELVDDVREFFGENYERFVRAAVGVRRRRTLDSAGKTAKVGKGKAMEPAGEREKLPFYGWFAVA